jgi:voltage-gated potassium channel
MRETLVKPTNPVARSNAPAMRHWIRSLLFTLVLVGMVAAAIGAGWVFTFVGLATSALSFLFFSLLIPGGTHFGVVVANFLALYACSFVFLRESNFAHATPVAAVIGLAMPVASFLTACFIRRRSVAARLRAHRARELEHLPRLGRWVPLLMVVGAASFAWPELHPTPAQQDQLLLGSMAIISVIVAIFVRDVVLLAADVALIFEGVAARLNRLVMPVMAFLTVYALIVVFYACLYRIAELTTATPQFTLHGTSEFLDFSGALWFSIVTLATVGYGDLAPSGQLARLLAAAEVVNGVLLLLFGFSEIMRHGGPDSQRRGTRDRQRRRPPERPRPDLE